jgi:uncharacterized membrane protein YeaQ/YmgE (transglycosylase-associated protein family)
MSTSSQVTDKERGSFPRQAALLCLAAPCLVFALSLAAKGMMWRLGATAGRWLFFGVGGMSCLMLLAGLILGILALAMVKPDRRHGILIRVLFGMVLNVLFLALWLAGFTQDVSRTVAQKQAFAKLASAARNVQQQATQSAAGGGDVKLDELTRSLAEAARTAPDELATIMQGTQSYMRKLQAVQANHTLATQELMAAQVLECGNLKQKEDLQARKTVVRRFAQANDAFKTFLDHNEANYRAELVQAKAPPEQMQLALGEFHKASVKRTATMLEICGTDHRIGESMLASLEMLEINWGAWRYDASQKRVEFADVNLGSSYNARLEEIRAASRDQQKAQQELQAGLAQQVSMR